MGILVRKVTLAGFGHTPAGEMAWLRKIGVGGTDLRLRRRHIYVVVVKARALTMRVVASGSNSMTSSK